MITVSDAEKLLEQTRAAGDQIQIALAQDRLEKARRDELTAKIVKYGFIAAIVLVFVSFTKK